jgi:tetratricopeptide (TPR) repeat protein
LRKDELETKNSLVFREELDKKTKYRIVKESADYYRGKNLEYSIKYYRKAVRLCPKIRENYKLFCSLSLKDKSFQELAEYLGKYNQHFSNPLFLDPPDNIYDERKLGIAYLKNDLLEEANYQFERIIKEDSEFADIHYQLGRVNERQGATTKAIENYKNAVALLPTHRDALNKLEAFYTRKGETEELKELKARIKQLTPVNKLDVNLSNKIRVLGYKVDSPVNKETQFAF